MGKNKKNEINIKKVLKKFCRMKKNCIFDESKRKYYDTYTRTTIGFK